MASLKLIFIVAAFICFVLAAIGVNSGKINLIAAGLALWVASLLF